jgi:hypothetical protein
LNHKPSWLWSRAGWARFKTILSKGWIYK